MNADNVCEWYSHKYPGDYQAGDVIPASFSNMARAGIEPGSELMARAVGPWLDSAVLDRIAREYARRIEGGEIVLRRPRA